MKDGNELAFDWKESGFGQFLQKSTKLRFDRNKKQKTKMFFNFFSQKIESGSSPSQNLSSGANFWINLKKIIFHSDKLFLSFMLNAWRLLLCLRDTLSWMDYSDYSSNVILLMFVRCIFPKGHIVQGYYSPNLMSLFQTPYCSYLKVRLAQVLSPNAKIAKFNWYVMWLEHAEKVWASTASYNFCHFGQ